MHSLELVSRVEEDLYTQSTYVEEGTKENCEKPYRRKSWTGGSKSINKLL